MSEEEPSRDWATTAEVAKGAGVKAHSTVFLWVKRGVLPEPTIIERGRLGRTARWPLDAPAQAAWVRKMTTLGYTWEEIARKLKAGEFKP